MYVVSANGAQVGEKTEIRECAITDADGHAKDNPGLLVAVHKEREDGTRGLVTVKRY